MSSTKASEKCLERYGYKDMFLADQWKDYEVLDCSDGDKLERWGKYILRRPDPQVIWQNVQKAPEWKKLNAHYHRSAKGGGQWEFFDLPEVRDLMR